ncbi:MAG: DUF1295 domain-containing protein [Planctomycetes bacterium]|nr:DUF1295 domain-containing protein [Planctomycetota bacterium]
MTPLPLSILAGLGWVLAALAMGALWLVQRRTRDATTVDVAWAALLGVMAVLYALLGDGLPARRLLVALLVAGATWRLALHLWFDRARKGVEDGRYAALRAKWGTAAQRNFFWFFQAQALLDVLLSLPFLLACASSTPLGGLDLVALLLWAVAICGEALADAQLAAFKAEPAQRGRTCRRGLWSVSRHPNYFFQWLLWCSYALLALSAPMGWIGLASPVLMLVLILCVTGIPPTEAQALRTRGEDYREYQRTTSAFVPWFRKHGAQGRTV